ncbi:MAG: hypothetical protein OEY14_11370, partial [Myxococcales bacterium]|nr:hypothetical protein [Myxococcales bacterium]
GFAEILKHALAEDAAFFERLLAPDADLGDLDFVGECIEHTIRLKCALIVADPSERDQGMVLHYGHTVGHAVEQATGYRLGHGHSVAIGMVAAAHLAAELGVAELGVLEAHHGLLARHGLPRAIPDDAPLSSLLAPLRASKRRVGDTLQMALVARVGELHRGSRGAALSIPLPRLVRSLEALAP